MELVFSLTHPLVMFHVSWGVKFCRFKICPDFDIPNFQTKYLCFVKVANCNWLIEWRRTSTNTVCITTHKEVRCWHKRLLVWPKPVPIYKPILIAHWLCYFITQHEYEKKYFQHCTKPILTLFYTLYGWTAMHWLWKITQQYIMR